MKCIAGSVTGGIKEIQEMLDFAGDKGVAPLIETIAIQDVNQAMVRMRNKDVRYRFVVDVQSSLKDSSSSS